jgi:hypothetical protein
MDAYITSGFCGEIASAMRPTSRVGSPLVSFFHVAPPSVDL